MATYSYHPLEGDEIRLLELFYDKHGSDLHGQLDKFRLPEVEEPAESHEVLFTREGVIIPNAPPYEALSYTWGGSNGSQINPPIKLLQGGKMCELRIKPNLHDALLRLRDDIPAGQSRRIWIDAICIRQVSRSRSGKRVGDRC